MSSNENTTDNHIFLILSYALRTLLAGESHSTIFKKLLHIKGECYRHQKNRETLRIALGDQYYFLKRHTDIGWREIIKSLLQLRLPVVSAKPEWLAIQKLNELNIATTPFAGYGQCGRYPAHLSSFLLTKEITQAISLEDFCRHWPAQPPELNLRHALIKQVAHIARTLHQNGINHRDFYICHFLMTNDDPHSPFKLSLIDLHRAQIHNKTPKRAIIKDLAALYFSALDIGLTTRDLIRFIKIYSAQPLKKQLSFWRKIARRALKLYVKIQLKNLQALTPAQAFTAFWLTCANSPHPVLCQQLIRIVPDKRWVFFAVWQQQPVVIKLFKQSRHAEKELQGYQLLNKLNFNTPKILFHGWLQGEGLYAIIYAQITPSHTVAEQWPSLNTQQKITLFKKLLTITARLHQAGVQHKDPHFKNFLVTTEQKIIVLDSAAIWQNTRPNSEEDYHKNLAQLLVQLPVDSNEFLEDYYRFYLQACGRPFTTNGLIAVEKHIVNWRKHYLRAFGRKALRSSTAFICRHSWSQFSVGDRAYDTEAMRLFLSDPETILQGPLTKILKAGNTCTVMLIEISGHKLVVKRYNIKNFWHGIKRALQPTRATISWRNAQRLMLLNFPTAKPIALLEQRFGFVRRTSYLVSEYVTGTLLVDYLTSTHIAEERLLVAEKIIAALKQLANVHISHGDLKATNILMNGSQPVFLDLDAMRLHRFAWAWRKAQQKDWQRLLKNWQYQPEIREIFEQASSS